MPQILIDPKNIGSPTTAATVTLLSSDVRKFGFVPDFAMCKAGDLVLSYSPSYDIIEKLIVYGQKSAGFHPEHSRWTHAAVFLYEDFVVEAIPSDGVITRSLYTDIPGSVFESSTTARLERI